MRRMTSAVAVLVATFCAFLFTASVAGAQAPDATISVTGGATTWSPPTVTVTTGDTVRWSFDRLGPSAQRPRNDAARRLGPAAANADRPLPRRRSTTPSRRRRLHVRVRRAPRHDRNGHGRGSRAPTRSRTSSSSTRSPASRTTRATRASPRSRSSARPTTSPSPRQRGLRGLHHRQPRPVRRRRLPLHDRRRPHRRAAGGVRGLHPAPAAATSASTRPPTPSTRGPGTARWSAATSATTRPAPPPRRSTSRTATSRPPRACPTNWARTDEWYNFQSPDQPRRQRRR